MTAITAVALPVVSGARDVYRKAVPSTEDWSLTMLRDRLAASTAGAGPRVVFLEPIDPSPSGWDGRGSLGSATSTLVRVDSLTEVERQRLDRADAEVVRTSRLYRADRALCDCRRQAVRDDGVVEEVTPRCLRLCGPALNIILHPQIAAGCEPIALHTLAGGLMAASMPEAPSSPASSSRW